MGRDSAAANFSCGFTRMLNTVSRTFGIFVLMFLRMKPSVRFASPTMLNVRIPGETAGDINPKILEIISDGLQYLAMESACNFRGTPGTYHLHHLAFRGAELHIPPGFPRWESIHVILEGRAVILAFDLCFDIYIFFHFRVKTHGLFRQICLKRLILSQLNH